MSEIDLRSDTVTRPDEGMYEAMRRAPLGDDVFGDDPTTIDLEARVAALTGKEAALLVPSGTMANSVALAIHCRPGDEVILETLAHSFNFEGAAAARLFGIQLRPLTGERGQIPLEAIAGAIRPDDVHVPRTSLVLLEQTSNIAGGCVLPLDYLRDVSALCRDHGLAFHIDGARVFNASVASGVTVRDIADTADSMIFCFSKALGAPAGSVLVGAADFIAEGRRVRKALGGGLRQAGIIAACGLYALDHNVGRLEADHRRAREFAQALCEFLDDGIDVPRPETNMVFVRWSGGAPTGYADLVARLRAGGVRAVALGRWGVRFVFHGDVDDADLARAIEVTTAELARALRGPKSVRG